MRFRNLYIVASCVMAIILLFTSDPDVGLVQNMPVGAGTIATLILMFKAVLGVAVLHFSRKALMDYAEADFQAMLKKALETPTGAGLAAIACSLMTIAIAIVIGMMVV